MPVEKKRLNEVSYVKFIKNFYKQNSQIRVYQCHMSKVHSVDWNVDGRKLASGKAVTRHISNISLIADHLLNRYFLAFTRQFR